MKKIIIWSTSMIVFAPIAYAQGYNCRYAKNASEIFVCQDSDLARLDEEVNLVYSGVRNRLKKMGANEDLRQLESVRSFWIKKRNACGRDYDCLSKTYKSWGRAMAQLFPE